VWLLFVFPILGIFLIVPQVFAAITISFSNAPASVDESQEFAINVTLVCPGCSSDSYIRGVLYPSGTSYFGFTQNNTGDWINAPGGSCTQYFKVAAEDLSKEGTWSGILKIKPDTGSPYFANPGDYLFKIGRYTTSCSATWSQETTITITGPSPTPTPLPTPEPTKTPTPVPTSTVTPTQSPTPTPTQQVNSTYSDSITPLSRMSSESGEVPILGDEIVASPASTLMATGSGNLLRPLLFSFICIGLGMGILSGVFVWERWIHTKDQSETSI